MTLERYIEPSREEDKPKQDFTLTPEDIAKIRAIVNEDLDRKDAEKRAEAIRSQRQLAAEVVTDTYLKQGRRLDSDDQVSIDKAVGNYLESLAQQTPEQEIYKKDTHALALEAMKNKAGHAFVTGMDVATSPFNMPSYWRRTTEDAIATKVIKYSAGIPWQITAFYFLERARPLFLAWVAANIISMAYECYRSQKNAIEEKKSSE